MTRTRRRRNQSSRYVNRNRQWGARQNTFSLSMRSATAVVTVLVGAIVYLVSVHARDAVHDEIQREESRRFALQEQLKRENAAWAEMRTPRSLVVSLASHGVAMSSPRSSQRVAMGGRSTGRAFGSGVYAANR